MDKVIWVDENDQELGIIPGEKAHRGGLLERVVVVYVTREDGQVLVQERMDDGRFDHSSAGHVDPGEDYLQAAKRELKEELGIESDLVELGKTLSDESVPGEKPHRLRHLFKIFECRANPGKLQKEEVKSVFWANPKKIYEDMKNDPENKKFCGGFKISLKFYLEKKNLL
jgi:isopentenyl-diphosphate delta-isomerase